MITALRGPDPPPDAAGGRSCSCSYRHAPPVDESGLSSTGLNHPAATYPAALGPEIIAHRRDPAPWASTRRQRRPGRRAMASPAAAVSPTAANLTIILVI